MFNTAVFTTEKYISHFNSVWRGGHCCTPLYVAVSVNKTTTFIEAYLYSCSITLLPRQYSVSDLYKVPLLSAHVIFSILKTLKNDTTLPTM
jgi:hypothetical protein